MVVVVSKIPDIAMILSLTANAGVPPLGKEIMSLLQSICQKGKSVLMICHDKYLMNIFPSQMLYCYNNTISNEPENTPPTK